MPVEPRVLTDDEIDKVEGLAAVLTVEQLADFFGFSADTFRRICKRQPEVMLRYKKGRAAAIGKVAGGLLKDAIEGDQTARIFYLKTQAGWRETTRQEHTGADGGPIQTETKDALRKKIESRLARLAAPEGAGEDPLGAER